jgi:uncharacterized membrane protein
MLKTRAEYKQQAKELVNGKLLNIWIVIGAFGVATSIITGIGSKAGILATLFSLVSAVIMFGEMYAAERLFITVVKGETIDYKGIILEPFKTNQVRNLLLGLVKNLYIAVFSLLLIVPGVIKAYEFAMAHYLVVREPELEWKAALDKSKKLMDGHKMELFTLDLSYLLWYILVIPLIWFMPRNMAARTLMYNEIYEAASVAK